MSDQTPARKQAPPIPAAWSCCWSNVKDGHAAWCIHTVGFWRWLFGRKR